MAVSKSAQNPHKWPNGEWHSVPWSAAKQNPANQGPAKGLSGPAPLPPPPPGTYDPAIDHNAGGAQRGYENTRDDAATLYTQGQEDYGLGIGDITRTRDRSLAGLLTGENRLNEDYGLSTKELGRQFGILGRQQAEGAAQRGVTSAGLLGKSAAVRGENQAREQAGLDLSRNRGIEDIGTQRTYVGEDFDRGKLGLDLGNARAFGGYGGNTILNPITGQPQVGSLLTGLTRSGTENNQFQAFSAGQRVAGAQQSGYVAPGVIPTTPSRQAALEFQRRLNSRKAPPKGRP